MDAPPLYVNLPTRLSFILVIDRIQLLSENQLPCNHPPERLVVISCRRFDGVAGIRTVYFTDFKIQWPFGTTFGTRKDSCRVPSSFEFFSTKCAAAMGAYVQMNQWRCSMVELLTVIGST
jgi:hypothetical protein